MKTLDAKIKQIWDRLPVTRTKSIEPTSALTLADLEARTGDSTPTDVEGVFSNNPPKSLAEANARHSRALAKLNTKNANFWSPPDKAA